MAGRGGKNAAGLGRKCTAAPPGNSLEWREWRHPDGRLEYFVVYTKVAKQTRKRTPVAGREGDRGRVVGGEQGGRHTPIHVSGAQYGEPQSRGGRGGCGLGAPGRRGSRDMGGAALRGGGVNTQAIRQTVGNIRSDAQGVKAAYNAVRGPGNPLERPR